MQSTQVNRGLGTDRHFLPQMKKIKKVREELRKNA